MDGNGRTTSGVATNDNGKAEARVRSAVLTLARLLGRQIAREQNERVISANDNMPVYETEFLLQFQMECPGIALPWIMAPSARF